MIWKSNVRFGQEPETGTIFNLKGCGVRITIHKFAGCGENLYLSCPELSISEEDLKTEDFNEATKAARKIVKKRIDFLIEATKDFITQDSKEEFTRY